MKTRHVIQVSAVLLYGAITWTSHSAIAAMVTSWCSYCLLTIAEFASPAHYVREGLPEFWIAGIVWVAGGVAVVRRLIRRPEPVREKRSTVNAAAVTFLVLLGFVALTAPVIAPLDPNLQGELTSTRLLAPMSIGARVESTDDAGVNGTFGLRKWYDDANRKLLQTHVTFRGGRVDASSMTSTGRERPIIFLFGTDDLGRDVFSRIVYGTRVSFLVGLLASLGSVVTGMLVGFCAGYSRRLIDTVLMRATDLALSIPSLFLVITVIAFLGKSVITLVVVLSLTGWMGMARTVRTEVLRLREKEFVLAARLLNQSRRQVLWRHILPNLRPVLAVAAILQFGNVVLAEAALSFLGLGIQPPTASWGNMLWQSLNALHAGWWLGVFPGALLASVLIASHYAIEEREQPA